MTKIYENLYVGNDGDFKSITDLEDCYNCGVDNWLRNHWGSKNDI